MANGTNGGIAGHSYGGMATVISARDPGSNIHAAFALHPCPCFEGAPPVGCPAQFTIDIPIYFVTGTLDTICLPTYVKADYTKTVGAPKKSFAEMVGSTSSSDLFPNHLSSERHVFNVLYEYV